MVTEAKYQFSFARYMFIDVTWLCQNGVELFNIITFDSHSCVTFVVQPIDRGINIFIPMYSLCQIKWRLHFSNVPGDCLLLSHFTFHVGLFRDQGQGQGQN